MDRIGEPEKERRVWSRTKGGEAHRVGHTVVQGRGSAMHDGVGGYITIARREEE